MVSGAPVHGQVNQRLGAANLLIRHFLVAFSAFSMFDLSPDCNKCCFAHLA